MALNKEIDSTTKKVVLIVTTIAAFTMPFSMAGVNIALPAIGKEFSLNAVLLSWIVTATTLASGVIMIPTSRAADIYGRRKIFFYGSVLQCISGLAAALAPNYAIFMVARVIQGIGLGMSIATCPAMLVSVYPANERGKVLGINIAAIYIGLSIAPIVDGLMTQYFGWRSIFYLCALFAIVIIAAVLWKIKGEWAEARGENLDIIGSIIFGIALVAIVYSVSILPAVSAILILIAGLVTMVLFVIWELRVKSPLVNIDLFRHNRVFAFSNIATLINYMATFAVGLMLSLYLQYIKGFDPSYSGILLLFQPVAMAIVAPFAGRLSDKVRPQLVSSTGMVLTTVGIIMFAFLSNDTPIFYIIIAQVITGLGLGAFSSPNTNAIVSSVDKKYYGIASGIMGTMRATGQMLSLGIITLLFALFIGHEQITPEYYSAFLQSTHIIFIISAVLCFGGIFASMVGSRTQTTK